MTKPVNRSVEQLPCSLTRRLGAILYDCLLLLSVLLFATVLVLIFTGGEAVHAENFFTQAYLFLIMLFYFVVPWVVRGQTLGMQTWKLKVLHESGVKISWWQAIKRFFLAMISWLCLGLGFFWALFDSDRRTWHDRLSHTHLVYFRPVKN